MKSRLLFFVSILLLWAGLHAYVIARLTGIPIVARYVPPAVLIPIVVFLGASYILSRVMEHYELGKATHVLEYLGATWVGIFFLIFVVFLSADIITGFGFILPALTMTIRTAALAAAGALAAIAFVQAWRTPVVTEYDVALPGLPASADGTVMVVASDLHLGAMLGHRWAAMRAAQFDALMPDFLVLAGDIFEGEEKTHSGWLPLMRLFRAPLGVFVVTGNHEFYADPDAIVELYRRADFRILRDEHCEVFPGLVVAGVDDIAFRRRGKHDQAIALEQALSNRPVGAAVFISHTPVLAERAAQLGAGLMVSGHTHEGQIWPFKYLVRIVFRLLAGRYDVNGMTAIVGRGTGTWGPRMRLWKRSEILRIKLRSI